MLKSHRHQRVLFTAHEITLSLEGGRSMGPWSGSVKTGQRIGVQTARPEQWEALLGLLTGEIHPSAGRLEEIGQVVVQSDIHIRDTLDLNRSVLDFLHSPDAPEYVWMDQRRKVLAVMLDALGIRPDMTRPALKLTSPEVIEKFQALRFMVSKAQVLLGRDIFTSKDEAIQRTLSRRWLDFPGVVIGAKPTHPSMPGPVDESWRIDEDGRFFVEFSPGTGK